jgi:hypothetical protein
MNAQLTKNEQLIGLLTGEWTEEAKAAFRDARHREIFTVKKADIVEFLRSHQELALPYLKKWEDLRPAADINVMWREGAGFKVAWMTLGGQPWAIQEFKDLNEAIVEHVCRQSGIRE